MSEKAVDICNRATSTKAYSKPCQISKMELLFKYWKKLNLTVNPTILGNSL